MFSQVGFRLETSSKFRQKRFKDNEFAKDCFVYMFAAFSYRKNFA